MLFEKISEDEIEMIDTYRSFYAYSDYGTKNTNRFVSAAQLLKPWEEAKSEYLAQLFGGKLTLTKHLKFEKSIDELYEEMDNLADGLWHGGRVERRGNEFIHDFCQYIRNKINDDTLKNHLYELITNDTLIANRYDGDAFVIPSPDGKDYVVRHGCKPMRALGKVAEIFGLENFEDFRLCHSQILNQKSLGGDLTISIHPFDYMTMSDNECGWDSCMNWVETGSYRQGTVEMMNSKCVIVAYLTAEKPMRVVNDLCWNNKKWRQLFVVDKNVIIGIKGYPYQNSNLTQAVLEWLRELAQERLNWTYGKHTTYGKEKPILLDKGTVSLYLETGSMYNDLGTLSDHDVIFNYDISDDELTDTPFGYEYNIQYSGCSECMICGATGYDAYFNDESYLACQNCQTVETCDRCGEYSDDYYYIDGERLCENCYNDHVVVCAGCDEEHLDDTMKEIYVIPKLTLEEEVEAFNKLRKDNRFTSAQKVLKSTYNLTEVAMYAYYPYYQVCDLGDCFEGFIAKNLKEGCRPWSYQIDAGEKICVYWEDLNEEAQEDISWAKETWRERAMRGEMGYYPHYARRIQQL